MPQGANTDRLARKRSSLRRHGVAALAFVATIACLAACTNSSGEDAGDEVVTINYVGLALSAKPTEVISKFEDEHPNIRVNWISADSGSLAAMLRPKMLAGESGKVDVIGPLRTGLVEYVKNDLMVDLTDMPFLSNYSSAAVARNTFDGKVYAVGQTAQAYTVFYNKTLFEKHGLEAPQNWDEFMNVSKVLESNGVTPMVENAGDNEGMQIFAGLTYAGLLSENPSWISDAAAGKVKWTDPDSLAAIQRIETYADKGYFLESMMSMKGDQAYQVFSQGDVAMWMTGAWNLSKIVNAPPSFDVGAFAPPGNNPGQEVAVAQVSGNPMGIAKSGHVEEAQEFLSFLSEPENAQILVSNNKSFSTVKGVEPTFSEYAQILTPIFAAMPSEMMHADVTNHVGTVMGPILQQLVLGEVSPEEVAAQLQDAQEKDTD